MAQLTFLIIEALVLCETSVSTYKAALRHSPDDCYFITNFYVTNMDRCYQIRTEQRMAQVKCSLELQMRHLPQ